VRNPAGRKFFEKKYGVPDGSEVQKLADARNWYLPHILSYMYYSNHFLFIFRNNLYEAAEKAVVSEKEKDEVQLKKDFDKLFVLDEESDTVSVLDYLSRGLPLPSSIIDFTLFIRSHQAQLEVLLSQCTNHLISCFFCLFSFGSLTCVASGYGCPSCSVELVI